MNLRTLALLLVALGAVSATSAQDSQSTPTSCEVSVAPAQKSQPNVTSPREWTETVFEQTPRWWWRYLLFSFVAALLVRAVITVCRAWAAGDREHEKKPGHLLVWNGLPPEPRWVRRAAGLGQRNWASRFGAIYLGFGYGPTVNDHWLNFWVGWSEVLAYPFIFRTGAIGIIGAWLLVKTAGQWRVWARSRTAFNRYLVGNLACLLASLVIFWWLPPV